MRYVSFYQFTVIAWVRAARTRVHCSLKNKWHPWLLYSVVFVFFPVNSLFCSLLGQTWLTNFSECFFSLLIDAKISSWLKNDLIGDHFRVMNFRSSALKVCKNAYTIPLLDEDDIEREIIFHSRNKHFLCKAFNGIGIGILITFRQSRSEPFLLINTFLSVVFLYDCVSWYTLSCAFHYAVHRVSSGSNAQRKW